MFGLLRRYRRRKWAALTVPEPWRAIVRQNLPFVSDLRGDEAGRFYAHLMMFAHEKRFEGIGIDVDDEIRVTVSGVAARLSRNVGYEVYDELYSVVVYPSTVAVPREETDEAGLATSGHIGALGLAHRFGTVVLAWDAVTHGLKNPADGHDTTLHELAHIIDMKDGAADGTPALATYAQCREWARVFSAHYAKLRARPHGGVLRAYGATDEAEFFAVATEAFFEKPTQLARRAPDLYRLLAEYYRVDPASSS